MRVLVTGAAGFTGSFLVRYLLHETGVNLTGLVRKKTGTGPLPPASCIVADLLDPKTLVPAVARVRPDAVIHLGGITRGDLGELLTANVAGTKNILDASFAANPDCRILVASSSAVYGYAGETPIPESTPLRPLSGYGISKMAQEAVALMHHDITGSHVAIARPFNLAGPGQPESFLCGRLVRQAADNVHRSDPVLDLLETSSSRDLVDVRDVVRGYWALVSRPEFSSECSGKAFNLGSGKAYPVTAIIAMLEEITQQHYAVHLPATVMQPPIPSQKSDNGRMTALTGWKPEIPLVDTLRDMFAEVRPESAGYRERVR